METQQISKYFFEEFFSLNPEASLAQIQMTFKEITKLGIDIPCDLLTCAFTHKSFAHEVGKNLKHNEQLEFLGDAVLDLIVSKKLMKLYPHLSEGELSKLRSSIVNEQTLASIANGLNLSKYILIGKGELKSEGHEKPSLLSNTLEAIIGAIFESQGLEQAENFFINAANNISNIWSTDSLDVFDAKTKLQEIVMKKFKTLPRYESEQIDQNFAIKCFIADTFVGELTHNSKKKGMQELAHKILNEKTIENMESKC